MHARGFLLALALTLAAVGAADAQTKPRRVIVQPRPTPDAAVAIPVKPASPTAPAPLPTLTLGGLVGLPPVGDPGPACRAQCSKDRYVCHAAGDATDCDGRWIPCLRTCSSR